MQRMKSGQKHEPVFALDSSSSDPVSDQIGMKDDYGHKKRERKVQEGDTSTFILLLNSLTLMWMNLCYFVTHESLLLPLTNAATFN